jgi:TM2 domain-containing membrane protein YozV
MRPGVAAVALASVCAGCATAPRPPLTDDAKFTAAEQHLAESVKPLVAPRTLAPDEVLYLQAESFFLYRTELARGPSAGSYLAQAAAAFTDFAALNVLAASQGQLELRLRVYDGAARLYSTLTTRYPDSALRPRALYRLGWACRSTSDEDCGSDASFQALWAADPGSALAGRAREAILVPSKSLGAATAWSILPGAGQLYVGEVLNGSVRLSVAAGFGALTLVPIITMVSERRFGWLPTALSFLGLVGLQVTYTTSYQDAQRAVLDFNERQEAVFEAAHPVQP